MKVFIEKDNKEIQIDRSCTGKELLQELGINPTTVLLIRNNEAVLSDEPLSETDEIKILSVISGG